MNLRAMRLPVETPAEPVATAFGSRRNRTARIIQRAQTGTPQTKILRPPQGTSTHKRTLRQAGVTPGRRPYDDLVPAQAQPAQARTEAQAPDTLREQRLFQDHALNSLVLLQLIDESRDIRRQGFKPPLTGHQ
jgi:hypothetical protein